VTQLEGERTEIERQAQAERERLAQLENERIEAEKREEAEKEKFAQLEKKRTEAQTQEETEKETLARLERERTETERQAQTERERLAQMERERAEAARRKTAEPGRVAPMGGVEGRGAPDFLPASTLKGYKVVNMNGDNIGRVEDLMIDLNNGVVAYAAISLGGFMGMSDKLFAIPWPALSYIPDAQAFILAVPTNTLEKAEGFDRDKCPTTRDELMRSYTYFGYQPYWSKMTREERVRQGRLDTAEELMAAEDVEDIVEKEKKETDPEKLAELERKKKIAEKRAHKYD
jgi:sporulation protein YlmC with PRC-barrel domain